MELRLEQHGDCTNKRVNNFLVISNRLVKSCWSMAWLAWSPTLRGPSILHHAGRRMSRMCCVRGVPDAVLCPASAPTYVACTCKAYQMKRA